MKKGVVVPKKEDVLLFEGEEVFVVSNPAAGQEFMLVTGEPVRDIGTGVRDAEVPKEGLLPQLLPMGYYDSLTCDQIKSELQRLRAMSLQPDVVGYQNTNPDWYSEFIKRVQYVESLELKKCVSPAVCDASIGQFYISVDRGNATISTTVIGNTLNPSEPARIAYSLDGAPFQKSTSTFQLTDLKPGVHSITVAAWCADGPSKQTQTKSFTIEGTQNKALLCVAVFSNISIQPNEDGTAVIDVSFDNKDGLPAQGIVYQHPTVNAGSPQFIEGTQLILRGLNTGESKVTLYPACASNNYNSSGGVIKTIVIPAKSTTTVTTTTQFIPPARLGGFGGMGGGLGAAPDEENAPIVAISSKRSWANYWWLLVVAGVVGYQLYKRKKNKGAAPAGK